MFCQKLAMKLKKEEIIPMGLNDKTVANMFPGRCN